MNAYRTTVLAVMAGLGLLVRLCNVAQGAEERVAFNIPAQSLEQALTEFGAASGLQVLFDSKIAADMKAPAVVGELQAEDALKRLLEGTELRYEFINARTVAIRAVKREAQSDERPLADTSIATGLLRVAQAEAVGAVEGEQEQAAFKDEGEKEKGIQLEEVIVTGTHIQGVRNDTFPMIQFDRKSLEETGYSSTQDFIRSLPQNFAGAGVTEEGRFGNSNAAFVGINPNAATGIDLRGLGPSATLVLLNGHRMAPAAIGSFADVSLIPFSAIDRVDVLTDGSSATYGADAVGGVVNFVLRRDYNGSETRVRYGTVTNGGRTENLLAQTFGQSWDKGNALLALQYQKFTALPAEERSKVSGDLPLPSDLFPNAATYSAIAHIRHQLNDSLEIFGEGLFGKRDVDRHESPSTPVGTVTVDSGDSDQTNVVLGVRYLPTTSWVLEATIQNSKQGEDNTTLDRDVDGITAASVVNTSDFEVTTVDAVANGSLFSSRAGTVRAAIGATRRRESIDLLSQLDLPFGAFSSPIKFERNVTAVFAELHVPLVGEGNALPFLRGLDISLAARHDDYSDFGGTTNPRIGLSWEPLRGLVVRGSYSRSFRAPTANDVSSAAFLDLTIFGIPDPSGTDVPVFLTFFNNLVPERAETLSVGADFNPASIPGVRLSANYYDVRFVDRIAFPPSAFSALLEPEAYAPITTTFVNDAEAQAYLDEQIARGVIVNDVPGTGAAGVRHAINAGYQNLGKVHQSGFDLLASCSMTLSRGTLGFNVNATQIGRIDTAFTRSAPVIDAVDIYGSPTDWKARAGVNWESQAWGAGLNLNYADQYRNPGHVPSSIGSWVTADLFAHMDMSKLSNAELARGLSMSASVQNILDRDPPLIDPTSSFSGIRYDQANASALGRFVAIELQKAW